MAVRPRAAGVRRRSELPQQAQFVEGRLELAPATLPLDLCECAERRLDRGPLPLAGEVRAQTGGEVACAPHVQRLTVDVAEDVGSGTAGSSCEEAALGVQPPGARRGEVDELGDRLGAALLGEPDQPDQDLSRGCCVRKRPVARLCGRPEELGQAREPEVLRPSLEQPSREPDRVDHRRRDSPPGQAQHRVVEEGHVEARVVGDEHRLPREREEAADGEILPGRFVDVSLADAREGRDRGRHRHARVHKRLERVATLERHDALRPDLDDARAARREPGRLQVEDDERRLLERRGGPRRIGEADRGAAPLQPRVTGDDLVEQRAGNRRRRRGESEEGSGGVRRGDVAVPRLDQLHEPVGSVERELHPLDPDTNMCSCPAVMALGLERAPAGALSVALGGGCPS